MNNINFNMCMSFLNWDSIYVGIKEDILTADSAVLYASEFVEKCSHIDSPGAIQILIEDNINKDSILPLICEIADMHKASIKQINDAKRVLRYAFLLTLKNESANRLKLLEGAEEIYATFGYPKDMENFIPYMPANDNYDPSTHSTDENVQHLIDNFDDFMTSELKWINRRRR